MTENKTAEIMAVVTQCDDVIMATCGADAFPDARHLTNAMNRDARTPELYFMTGRGTDKFQQLNQNGGKCCLYYFNPANRHAVRLYGRIEFVAAAAVRHQYWRAEYSKFGYGGPDDSEFVLMRFIPHGYKYYAGAKKFAGAI